VTIAGNIIGAVCHSCGASLKDASHLRLLEFDKKHSDHAEHFFVVELTEPEPLRGREFEMMIYAR
jgi:hypothetical protein